MKKTNETATTKATTDSNNSYLATQAEELKLMLKERNLAFYKRMSVPCSHRIMASRLWPVVPTGQVIPTYEQLRTLNLMTERKLTISFAHKDLTWDAQYGRKFCLKDAMIKAKFLGEKHSHIFYSWDADHIHANLCIGGSSFSKGLPLAFLMEDIRKDMKDDFAAWELEEFAMMGITKKCNPERREFPTSQNEHQGLFVYFDKAQSLLHIDTVELDFEPLYYNYYGTDDVNTLPEGGIELLDKDVMELYRVQTMVADRGTADDKTD